MNDEERKARNAEMMRLYDLHERHLPVVEIDPIDEAYRRGYHHGFITGRTQPDVTENEIRLWRYSDDKICPPGSPMEGVSRDMKRPFQDMINDLPLSNEELENMEET